MNKLFSIFNYPLSILLGGFLLLIACKEDKEEPLHFETTAPAAYTFPETETSATFTVSGNTAWSIEVTEGRDLCSVTPASGKSNATVTVHVTANPAYLQERTMSFALTAGDYTKQVNITQAAPPCPDFDPGAIATAGQTVTVGGTPATINSTQAATGGNGQISYQWYKNGNPIAGATEAYYIPPQEDAATVSVITYTRRAKDNTCNTTFIPSGGAWVLTVVCPGFNPGAIVTTGQTVTVGGTPITINSAQDASGIGAISYQWYKNNTAIDGATEAYYTPPPADATVVVANTYTRRAKDNVCNTTLTASEGNWVLTVKCPSFDAGAIVTTGQTIAVGGTPVTINSTRSATGGDGQISYQWYKDGNAINGATAAYYTPPPADVTSMGVHIYIRHAKDNTCNTTFTPSEGTWTLTAICPNFNPGTIATTGQAVNVGGTPTTINSMQNATGSGIISYQWYKDGNPINGATAANYMPPATDAVTEGTFTYTRKTKESTCNTIWSDSEGSWVLTVKCPLFNAGVIATTGQTLNMGGTPSTINSVQNATGGDVISHQWYKDGNFISGATTTNYTPPLTDAAVVGIFIYTRRAKDNSCNTTLAPSAGSWILNVVCPPLNTGAIATTVQTLDIGGTPSIINSVQNATGGYGQISYQWYKNGNPISSATTTYYTPPKTDAATVGIITYTRHVKDNTCNTTFTPSVGSWTLNVVCPPLNTGAIATTGQTVNVGGTPLTITSKQNATGGYGQITYQWYRNDNAIENATFVSYTPPSVDVAVAGVITYTRRAKDNTCNTTLAQSAGSWTLNVICPPLDAGAIATVGETIIANCFSPATILSLQDATGNGTVSYQWYKNNIAINGATMATYTPPLADAATPSVITYTRAAKDNTCNTTLLPSQGSWILTAVTGAGDRPGSTATFSDFMPICATTGSTWTLTDERDNKTYVVKLMSDERYWMIQDLRYGGNDWDACINRMSFSGTSSTAFTHRFGANTYGDCTNRINSSTPAERGYLYDWAATTQMQPNASGCSGITAKANECVGICPPGFHVPTRDEFSHADEMFESYYSCEYLGCWNSSSQWAGVNNSYCTYMGALQTTTSGVFYWSSTNYANIDNAYYLSSHANRMFGMSVRCVRNY
ncbi:MAG: hypothetical protein LBS55_12485 [Prevotellaceae bacterium]|jgi:uncharacterized protein (TIGR02145 family)|nr:hypothetical protein [Prevotellaceae bacterium]